MWVIDNSSDVEVARVTAAHAAEYVDTASNIGFAAGVNRGLSLVSPGSDVLLLNPDAVVDGHTVHALHRHLRAPGSERLAAVSPALVEPRDRSRQRVRWPLPTPGRMWREAMGLSRFLPAPDEFCIGAVLLLRAEAITDVGPFDERFFLYAEEADWQRRALARGWQTTEVPDQRALHIGAGTSADPSHREALFHAGQETYIRKWYGAVGWLSYRAAAMTGAAVRGVTPHAPGAAAARRRALLYLRGPRRASGIRPRAADVGRRVAHVVVTEAFAGVERYVCEVAAEQARRGEVVTVIGGDPGRMPRELGGARHLPAPSLSAAVRQLIRIGPQDIIHAHMTAAELATVATTPWHRAEVVSTRHFAGTRGSTSAARLLGRLIRRRIDHQIAISRFVASAIGEPAVVIPNGVRCQPERFVAREKVVLSLQRLEREKATDIALRAWAASGLGQDGWELHLAGAGALQGELEALASSLGINDSIRWLGRVTDTQDRLQRAGLLLATATAEPFGLSIAEAMALGTPVLASDGGAHLELLGPGGWTFPGGEAAAAAKELRRIAGLTPEERAGYGRALRTRQRGLFALAAHVDRLSQVYGQTSAPA